MSAIGLTWGGLAVGDIRGVGKSRVRFLPLSLYLDKKSSLTILLSIGSSRLAQAGLPGLWSLPVGLRVQYLSPKVDSSSSKKMSSAKESSH